MSRARHCSAWCSPSCRVANFKDPIHAGRQRALDQSGADSFSNYSVPLAAMQLKQGFGRLIRRASDHGCVFLLDSRAAKARYGQTFIASLPGPKLFTGKAEECLKQAADFMAAVEMVGTNV
jgi:ATP-dependent DNA helicase DinG